MNAIQITIPCIFGVAAIVMCFFKRLPACLVAYGAYVSAGLLGVMHVAAEQYIIWGFIAVADTVNIYATRIDPSRAMRLYTVTGCLVGSLLGAVAGTVVAVMLAGALGAIIGFLAYSRTPAGRARLGNVADPKNPGATVSAAYKLSLLATAACTAWFTFILVALVCSKIFV